MSHHEIHSESTQKQNIQYNCQQFYGMLEPNMASSPGYLVEYKVKEHFAEPNKPGDLDKGNADLCSHLVKKCCRCQSKMNKFCKLPICKCYRIHSRCNYSECCKMAAQCFNTIFRRLKAVLECVLCLLHIFYNWGCKMTGLRLRNCEVSVKR